MAALAPFWHAWRVLTFRHTAKGLPTKVNFDFITLAALGAAIGTARWSIDHHSIALVTLLSYCFWPLVFCRAIPVPRMVVVLLALLGTDLIALAMALCGLDTANGLLYWIFLVWNVSAGVVGTRDIDQAKKS
ncbi:hypothetical protein [Burkholderia ambifaria]|uniref:hypothetical protein n=1 Tax=Burkholderia ambifaria TaxID=152480 RepID=UPI000F81235A|nr:hypothetical protein [Burkholderia ambifaria]